MSRTYKATGINLKAAPMGETDRLVTILTKEHGLLRAIAPGARKHKSRLGGRSGLFVVNELMLSKGKSLDKMIQAQTQRSFPGLSRDLARLTAGQYLAELVLCEASEQPQEALFALLVAHLERLETAPSGAVLACLAHGTFHILALAGVAPELNRCCLSRTPIQPQLGSQWQIGFSIPAGGVITLEQLENLENNVNRTSTGYRGSLTTTIGAPELALLQQLGQAELVFTQASSLPSIEGASAAPHSLWRRVERLLRNYAQFHFDRPIRSAALIDSCFASPTYAS
ncbi:dna replication and repair protein [Leptolyngbya sp. Heron Island J]|uniref:DNA repair protein RecO n=1 Tax=Leptolyngbya sp. Heron Island J TaxID=1385935 RepID=UPI0003B9882F|nr:DNA repair protein RecO [Leptolyngbya sp. Heron Island J]ESA36783.1 dna replication and repair protein [Leptolyngbya sp. Heron Island J]